MNRITLQEARDLYLTHPARLISQEQSRIYYENFSGDIDVIPYLIHGCLAVKSKKDWHIHALSENADLLSAIESVRKAIGDADESLMVLTWGDIPAGLQDKPGSYKFSRNCMPYSDDAIRPLTDSDHDAVLLCCAPDPEDNNIGQGIAEDFLSGYDDYLHDSNETLLGIFIGGALAGFVQSTHEKDLGIATINIFVSRRHRRKGYAKRLLSAICSADENCIYCYSCVQTNTASINTAKACGFEYRGAYLFLD